MFVYRMVTRLDVGCLDGAEGTHKKKERDLVDTKKKQVQRIAKRLEVKITKKMGPYPLQNFL